MAKESPKPKGKGAKSAPKKGKTINWSGIIIVVVLVFTLLGMIVAGVINGYHPGSSGSTSTGVNKTLNSISDALKLVPSNATFARFVDLKDDFEVKNWTSNNYWNTIPPSSIFNADPQKDALAVYPIDYFGYGQNITSVTDFGNSKLNQSYTPLYTQSGEKVLQVSTSYYFTPNTKPVVSGGETAVAATLQTMQGGLNSSYGQYADLFDTLRVKQINISGMEFETVGLTSNMNGVDRYYAGVGQPVFNKTANATEYTYVAILHDNHTVTSDEQQYLSLIENSMTRQGFYAYNIQVYGDYVVLEARAPLNICMSDMAYTWGFLKFLPGQY